MIELKPLDDASYEHKIEDGTFAGCTLYVRRPTYRDELASFMTQSEGEWLGERFKLIERWTGANGEPSPFKDERGTPIGCNEQSFKAAVAAHPELLSEAYKAIRRATARDEPGK